jgi:hypothetical protein
MDVLTVLRVVSQGEVASDELHVAFLARAEVVEDALVVPLVLVAELAPLLAGHDDDQRNLARREDAALPLRLIRATPFVMKVSARVEASCLEHQLTLFARRPGAAVR